MADRPGPKGPVEEQARRESDLGRSEERGSHTWTPGEPVDALRRHLLAGGVAAIPSESSYGLAADPRLAEGVEAIYRIKERERGKPLLVVAGSSEQLSLLGLDPRGPHLRSLERVWPAPLTAILPVSAPLPASAGGATLAVRIPAHGPLRRLLLDLGFPVTATSANRAGEPPIVDPADLRGLLAGHDRFVCDFGVLAGGLPSTLVAARSGAWQVLRPGAFDPRDLPAVE